MSPSKLSLKQRQENIDKRIEEWHLSDTGVEIHKYLGWTPREYARWVEDSNNLPCLHKAYDNIFVGMLCKICNLPFRPYKCTERY